MLQFKKFKKEINRLRLNNAWYYYNAIINNKSIQLKGYGTWFQIAKIDTISYSCTMDISVKEYNIFLEKFYNDIIRDKS